MTDWMKKLTLKDNTLSYCFALYVADPATFLGLNSFLGTRTACLFSYGNYTYILLSVYCNLINNHILSLKDFDTPTECPFNSKTSSGGEPFSKCKYDELVVRKLTDRTCMGNGMTERVIILHRCLRHTHTNTDRRHQFAPWYDPTLQGTWRNVLEIPQSPPHSLQRSCTFWGTIQTFGGRDAGALCMWVKGHRISTLIGKSDGRLRIQLRCQEDNEAGKAPTVITRRWRPRYYPHTPLV